MALVRIPDPTAVNAHTAGAAEAGTSTKPATRAEFGYYLIAALVLIGSAIVGAGLADGWTTTGESKDIFVPAEGVTALAVVVLLAQVLERILEPLTALYGQTTGPRPVVAGANGPAPAEIDGAKNKLRLISKSSAQKRRNEALAQAATAEVGGSATPAAKAAAWQEVVDQIASNTATLWAIASGIGMICSGWMGIFLLRALDAGKWDIPVAADVIVTGLVVGAGTKPLHDLISKIQKSKDSDSSPAEVGKTSNPGAG